ncbi:hypothetical protein QL982_08810 [Psychrobacter sp. 5A.1]|uniref:hypothetical protein n=2 Tax=unclassified Psychrobacter TaxID=196806 RepID=UPI0025B51396|nr:hypothetical protein [Psychrobacter sp. 5A.1]MDN3502838.1 hypothetical protein [Psychrobacter sp. 5A.1]
MKKVLFTALVSLSVMFVPYSSSIAQSNKMNDLTSIDQMYSSKLVGTWNCNPVEMEVEDATVTMKGRASYFTNKRSNTFGTMIIDYPKEKITLEYDYFGTGTWEINNKKLVEILEDIKLTNISHPYMNQSFNMTDMFPKNISASSSIISLSQSSMTLKEDTEGVIFTCSKK